MSSEIRCKKAGHYSVPYVCRIDILKVEMIYRLLGCSPSSVLVPNVSSCLQWRDDYVRPAKKLNEEAVNSRETDASPTSSSCYGGRVSFSEPKIEPSRETNGDLKRKLSEGVSEEQNHPSKSPRSSEKPSPSNKKGSDGFKKPKSRKAAWSILNPPKQPQINTCN